MKIIKDLMEAYSDHMNLPLLLITANDQLQYYKDVEGRLASIKNVDSHIKELKNLTSYLTKPTIISVSDHQYSSSPHYMVTPYFSIDATQYCLAAGPYWTTDYVSGPGDTNYLTEPAITDKLAKIQKLFLLLMGKERAMAGVTFPNAFLHVLKAIQQINPQTTFLQYITLLFEQCVKIEDLDFLGVALKDADELFTIQQVHGSKIERILQKRFFLGEGVLGKVAILGKEDIWHEHKDIQGADFFNRFGIFPKHLFVYPLMHENNVIGVFFSGNFQERRYNKSLVHLLEIIVAHMNQKHQLAARLEEVTMIEEGLEQLSDIATMAMQPKTAALISQKLLMLFESLPFEAFIYTLPDQENCHSQGVTSNELLLQHQLARQQSVHTYWHEGNLLHINLRQYGFYTLCFQKAMNNYTKMFSLLTIVEKVVNTNAQPRTLSAEFDLLHQALEGIHHEKHKKAVLALKIAHQWLLQQRISYERYQILCNICSVLPYSLSFLEKKIAHTEEWLLLMEAQKICRQELAAPQMSLEGRVLAFLYSKLILGQEVYPFLTADLGEQLMHLFHRCHQGELVQEDPLIHMQTSLTAREKEVLLLLVKGLNNKEVAHSLTISVHTVKNHVTSILKKFDVADRMQLMAKVMRVS